MSATTTATLTRHESRANALRGVSCSSFIDLSYVKPVSTRPSFVRTAQSDGVPGVCNGDEGRTAVDPNLPVKPSESDVAAQPFEFLALMRATATPACTLKPCASTHSAAVVFSVL